MDRMLLLALLLLPGLAHAVICKTVGGDGVVNFTDVPAAECPQGSRIPDYSRPVPGAERAGSLELGVSARQVKFAGYQSIEIVSPEAGGTVRSNAGQVPVSVQLRPPLQQSHFLTAYLDGKATRGRYGSSQIELTGVDRGSHSLRVKVSDSSGKILIESDTISFTVQKIRPEITVEPITGDDYLDPKEAGGGVEVKGTFTGAAVDEQNLEVKLRFPVSGGVYPAKVELREGTSNVFDWSVTVPGQLLASEASFHAVGVVDKNTEFKTTSTHSVDPGAFKALYSAPPADYTPPQGGISTTPGQTNPAFKPHYIP